MGAAAIVLLSLGLKANGAGAAVRDDPAPALAEVSDRLVQHGYAAAISLEIGRIDAARGACSLIVRPVDPHGTQYVNHRILAARADRIGIAWAGEWRDRRPWFGPTLAYFLARELSRQGLDARRRSAWFVAAGPECGTLPPAEVFDVAVPLQRH